MKILRRIVTKAFVLASLAALAASLMGTAPAGKPRRPVAGSTMRFVFRDFEGPRDIVCPHRLLSPDSPYDWKVECSDGSRKFAEYTAHVALTLYDHTTEPKLSVEMLYWLNGSRLPSEVGSTTWFHFAEKSNLQGVSMSQTVENGTAGLYLEIGSAAIRLSKWAR
ncbi:MAG: hypothetical protein JST04_01345 [Bdellovibrionales bacterium]|nr:hypothetical protein [Bdellovibrionales bacterium]